MMKKINFLKKKKDKKEKVSSAAMFYDMVTTELVIQTWYNRLLT